MEFDPDILAYYERGQEADRLVGGFPSGPLEFERTKELVLRYLPDGRHRVLDVGGGPGRYATWLTELGHEDQLVDPYHCTSSRQRALGEAHRVQRPGGLLVAAAISRFAALLDMLVRLDSLNVSTMPLIVEAVTTGAFRGGGGANAYFHLPSELAREVESAGFASVEVLNVEGPRAS